jgi:hypothetical protein
LASRARLTELCACRNKSAASIESVYASLEERERGSDKAHEFEAFTIIECSLRCEGSISAETLFIERAGWGEKRHDSTIGPLDRGEEEALDADQECISGLLSRRVWRRTGGGGLRMCATQGPGCSCWVGTAPHRCCSSFGHKSPAQMRLVQRCD